MQFYLIHIIPYLLSTKVSRNLAKDLDTPSIKSKTMANTYLHLW